MSNVNKGQWKHEPLLGSGFWIGVDLDGTLAKYDKYLGPSHIGEPITPTVDRVKVWLSIGYDVRIFTARVDGGLVAKAMGLKYWRDYENIEGVKWYIENWCRAIFGKTLPITNVKDFGCVQLWDDRAVQVEMNTGEIVMPCQHCDGYYKGLDVVS